MKANYHVTINSDRVHIVSGTSPVETFLFSQFMGRNDAEEVGQQIAIGVAITKAIKLNESNELKVFVK